MICLDSSFIIYLLKNKKEAVYKLEKLAKEDLATTRVNIYEVLFGAFIKKGIDHQRFSERINAFISKINVMELDEVGSINAAKIKADLTKKGRVIEDTDCLVSGIILSNNCKTIITRNKDHFDIIKEIKAEGY